MILDVVCPIPLRKTFDYLPPEGVKSPFSPGGDGGEKGDLTPWVGRRVNISFGFKQAIGLVVSVKETSEAPLDKLKNISGFLDAEPLLNNQMLELGKWLSERYVCSYGEALFFLLPPGKGNAKPFTDPGSAHFSEHLYAPVSSAPTFTADQMRASALVHEAVHSHVSKVFLIHGVAAAGKTEVYMAAVKDVLAQGKTALFLVPEIGLAVQTAETLKARFGEHQVLAWHSDMSTKERINGWMKIKRGEASIVVGPRSAVLAPLCNIGVIVVDEEHDHSYKEDRKPRFHAREVALFRARQEKAVALLGSATPSLETYHAAQRGELELIELKERAVLTDVPRMTLVDLSQEKSFGALSPTMQKKISERLNVKEQIILFINKRGFYRFLRCPSCTWTAQCPQCAIALVEHKEKGKKRPTGLWCHYCSYTTDLPKVCPQCQHKKLYSGGYGTQRVVDEIKEKFPWAHVLRWDRDAVSKKGEHGKIVEEAKEGNVDILVGTQLLAQGFNFPRVTMVGILEADMPLHIPDFRSSEHTFQLLTQVAGRAGRAMIQGEVVLQTRNADHYSIKHAVHFDYQGFAAEELKFRDELNYPPFSHLIEVMSMATNPRKAEEEIQKLVEWVEGVGGVGILGPTVAKRTWAGGKTRFIVLLKVPNALFSDFLKNLAHYVSPRPHLLHINVDPETLH